MNNTLESKSETYVRFKLAAELFTNDDVRSLPELPVLVRPENSELSESSIEEMLIAISKFRDKKNIAISIKPTTAYFTEECLRRWFGWTDEDFTR